MAWLESISCEQKYTGHIQATGLTLSSRKFCRRLTGAVVVAPARLLAVLYQALRANSALLDRVDLATRLSLSSLDLALASRLLHPRSGLERSDFVRWHFSEVVDLTGDVGFSNRPVGVKHFQTIHSCGVDVSHGLALLSGIGTWALPSWDPRRRRNNLLDDLTVSVTTGPSRHTNSPHPSSREGHLSTAGWNSGFLLSGLILIGFHAAATACSRVHRNSVPSTQMRCMMTASRRARATIAFFIPRRLAICMAQALSQDHFFECIMLCAAS